ncbi:MAG: mycofactocin-coupled SDR family oxidoreductase [Acidimicrobiales bacterium]
MGKLDGKVALITGAARGQGRSHAIRLAEEGASIIAADICEDVDSIAELYPLARPSDLDETVRLVESAGGRIMAVKADVRDYDALHDLVQSGLERFGHVDICLANAGVVALKRAWETPEETWDDVIGINLKGVWNTVRAVIPAMIERGQGGSIVITSSVAGLRGYANTSAYSASKHGVVGLMQSLANELAPFSIRVNTVHPMNVDTPMLQNEGTYRLFLPEMENPGREEMAEMCMDFALLPIPWAEARDVTAAVLWLVSDDARYVTGIQLPVDGGTILK